MKRKWFIVLVFLMSLSLLGIIMIQLYWINHVIQLNEARFDQSVQAALKEIAGEMEKKENAALISDRLKQYERTIAGSKPDLGQTHFTISSNDMAVDLRVDLNYDSIKQTLKAIKGYYELDTLSNAVFGKYVYTVSYGDSVNYFIVSHPDARTSRARQLEQVFEQMVIEAEDLVKPLEELYSPGDLHDLVQDHLWSNGIDQRFEYAVASGKENSDYTIISEGFRGDNPEEVYWVSLFPKEIYGQKDYQLLLTFPDKAMNLWKSVSLLLLISVILTLIIMTTFATTIYMILRQKKISDIKTDFINNMTHEFKTPIATISLAVDSINNPKTLDKKENILYYTGIIKEENKRMNAQVENVLQMSLLDKHEMEFNLQPYDLHELIRNAIRKISLQVEERKGRIEVNLEATQHIALVDEGHFTNAVLNLLDNANKYSPEAPEIFVSTSSTDQHITVRVHDRGIGMSKDTQKKIFEKFYRESHGNIHNVKGFGLGLTYVRAVLQVIRGKIKINSSLGKGSTFELIVPIVKYNG